MIPKHSESLFPEVYPPGFAILRQRFTGTEQRELLAEVRSIVAVAPLLTPTMANGVPFRLRLTNAGDLGWTAHHGDYRYVDHHPVTDKVWPSIPLAIYRAAIDLAADAGYYTFRPNSCLVNVYGPGDSLGLHRDVTERDFSQPVVSISLGDSCYFRLGGLEKTDPKVDYEINSGDAIVFGGPLRKAWHAVTKTFPGTLKIDEGRINLTLRRA